MIDRPLSDLDAEVSLLAACLASKNCRIEARRHLLSADFYQPAHEVIYATMGTLDRHGREVDPVTLRAALHAGDHRPQQLAALESILVSLVGHHAGHAAAPVAEYAAIIHGWALRRRLVDQGHRLIQQASSAAENPSRVAAESVTALSGIRDAGAGDVAALTLDELLTGTDEAPRWVIPGLMEAGDRLLLTGTEGAGKSALSRQFAVMAAAGLHPFTGAVMPPVRTMIFDTENKVSQVRRQVRPLYEWLARQPGAHDPGSRVLMDCAPRRLNLSGDRDLSRLHQAIDAWQPELVVLGPLYRLYPRSLNTDDDAHPLLAAFDTLIERGCALIIEAHAGHAEQQTGRQTSRNLRPRGSAALLGWPEFGLGLRGLPGGVAELEPWRGHREARAWPTRLRRAAGNRWVETHPADTGGDPIEDGVRDLTEPQRSLV
ncbi:AAA family ATPase [Pseudanabaena phage Pam4]|nr:AAA family ATPase [Pseudanabaena phage Pam4]